MRVQRFGAALLIAVAGLVLTPGQAAAASKLTFVLGALIGDELSDVTGAPGSIGEDFQNAPVYGARLGWDAYPFALEGSLVLSPGAVNTVAGGELEARLIYAEADLQILLFPGPLSPFVAAGIGLHNIKLEVGDEPSETVVGYIIGGGIRAGFGALGVRVDLRDHITPMQAAELDADFVEALGLSGDRTLHNVELSAGLTISF